MSYNNISDNEEPFRLETNEYKEIPYKNEFYKVISVAYSIGFIILFIPVIAFFYLMFMSSYRTYLYSNMAFKVLGGIGLAITFILIMILSISYKRVSNLYSRRGTGTFLTVGIIVILIFFIFIISGFVLSNVLLSGMELSKDQEISDNSLSAINQNTDNNNLGTSETEEFVNSNKKINENLNIYYSKENNKTRAKTNKTIINTSSDTNSDDFDALFEALSKYPIFKDLPKSGSIKVVFFSIENGVEVIDKSYIFSTDPELDPDVELFIDSQYIEEISEDLCSGIQSARNNDGFRYKLNKGKLVLFSKYSNLMKYKDCFMGS